jgi:hypothetical protein
VLSMMMSTEGQLTLVSNALAGANKERKDRECWLSRFEASATLGVYSNQFRKSGVSTKLLIPTGPLGSLQRRGDPKNVIVISGGKFNGIPVAARWARL